MNEAETSRLSKAETRAAFIDESTPINREFDLC
jgi:hypothetical protein